MSKAIKKARTQREAGSQSGTTKEVKNLQRQLAERLDLLTRFQAKAAPPPGPRCATCGGALELSGQYPDAGYLHVSDTDDTHVPAYPGTEGNEEEAP